VKHLRNWRLWLGFAVTVLCLGLVLRKVSFAELWDAFTRADLFLLAAISFPAHVAALYVRALRWRHLTDAVQPIGRGPLFRATAVGLMANNIFPLRVGELVRVWYLAREVKGHSAAILGTVILERVIDSLVIVGLAAVLLAIYGSQVFGSGAELLLVSVLAGFLLMLGLIASLRFAPHTIARLARAVTRPVLRERVADRLEEIVQRLSQGMGSLRGGMHLFWIAFHSVLLWLVLAVLPFWGGLLALGVDLGSFSRALAASYTTLVLVGVFISVPSAPGFFGPYHYACLQALSRFGVEDAMAVALGTLVHACFWLVVTGTGIFVLQRRHTSWREIEAAAASADGKAAASEVR